VRRERNNSKKVNNRKVNNRKVNNSKKVNKNKLKEKTTKKYIMRLRKLLPKLKVILLLGTLETFLWRMIL